MLLRLVVEKEVAQVQILGESKAVINWINGKNYMKTLTLLAIMEGIKGLKGIFSKKYFQHIYKTWMLKEKLFKRVN
jgi:hypothetical protein